MYDFSASLNFHVPTSTRISADWMVAGETRFIDRSGSSDGNLSCRHP